MSDTTTDEAQAAAEQAEQEKETQTQHVMSVALSNLSVVMDQLESLEDSRVEIVLEALDTAKTDLSKSIGNNIDKGK